MNTQVLGVLVSNKHHQLPFTLRTLNRALSVLGWMVYFFLLISSRTYKAGRKGRRPKNSSAVVSMETWCARSRVKAVAVGHSLSVFRPCYVLRSAEHTLYGAHIS